MTEIFGQTIQLFLVDGSPNGLIIASIHGWTGSVLVANQSTFDRLLARPEVLRTGIYILYGPDTADPLNPVPTSAKRIMLQNALTAAQGRGDFGKPQSLSLPPMKH
jgi:hypothetical protein